MFRIYLENSDELIAPEEIDWKSTAEIAAFAAGYDKKKVSFESDMYFNVNDSNGRHIFERDIVSVSYEDEGTGKTFSLLALVVFFYGSYVLYNAQKSLYISFEDILQNPEQFNVVVVGNLHKNPEMLGSIEPEPEE